MTDQAEDATEARRRWMGLLARAPEDTLRALWGDVDPGAEFTWLRPPEIGAVMVRGRMGGTGAPFNLGEMTVTRCALALADGTVGHAVVQGRSKAKAEIAALADALMHTVEAGRLQAGLLEPLAALLRDKAGQRAAKAAATKVDFFTMVRGEDA